MAIVVAVIAIGLFTLLLTNPRVTAEERSRVRSFIPMWLASVVFWSLFQQQFSVVEIYADERLDRMLGGWEMPTEFVNSLEPFFVIVLAPLFARAVDEARRPRALDAGEVRARRRRHGHRVPAVPALGRRDRRRPPRCSRSS